MKQTYKRFAGLLAVVLLAAPFAASALTTSDIQAQIQALLSKIEALKTQMQQLQTTTPTPDSASSSSISPRFCALLNRNLFVGARGDDVMSLQEFLSSEGYLSANSTGYYGPLTANAVAKWQQTEGVSAVGLVGPLSRERLMIRCGGVNAERFSATPQKGNSPLTVTFNTWISGFRVPTIYYMVDFGDGSNERATNCYAPADACQSPGQNTHTYSTDGTYTATLNKITDPCAGNQMCKAAIQTEVVGRISIKVGSIACTKEYMPVCGGKQVVCIKAPCNPVPTTYGNKCMMAADNATLLYEGQCKDVVENPEKDLSCKSWNDGCNSCSRSSPSSPAACTLMYCANPGVPYCTAHFDSTSNKPPVISGFSGPSTLAISATGQWTINASDPEAGQLSYQITWGDEALYSPSAMTSGAMRDFVQTTSFTHAYANAGTYTVTIVVRDSNGGEAKTSSTVQVGSSPVACTMQYDPVCGQPKWSCPAGMFCATVMPAPQTYGNRCQLDAAGASFMYSGQCSNTGVAI